MALTGLYFYVCDASNQRNVIGPRFHFHTHYNFSTICVRVMMSVVPGSDVESPIDLEDPLDM